MKKWLSLFLIFTLALSLAACASQESTENPTDPSAESTEASLSTEDSTAATGATQATDPTEAADPTDPTETDKPTDPTTPPATQPPATQPPATQPPTTQPPTTQPPATQPPATQPPTTQPPATQATQATQATEHVHNMQWQVTQEVSCLIGEWSSGQCSCGLNEIKETKPALGHYFNTNGSCVHCGELCCQGLVYTLNEDGKSWYLSGVSGSTSNFYYIPATYQGMPVTGIGFGAFSGAGHPAETLQLSEGLEWLDEGAFYSCPVRSLTLPATVRSIAPGMLTNSNILNLEIASDSPYLYMKDGVVFSKDGKTLIACLSGKSGEYTVPEGVTTIGKDAFTSRGGLTKITLPSTLKVIEENAFCGSRITSINLPEGLESIGSYGFDSCEKLTAIRLPSTLTTLGDGVFSDCEKLTEILVESGSTSFASADGVLYSADRTVLCCFPAGKAADSFVLPSSVTSLAPRAFGACRKLKSVTLNSTIAEIPKAAFINCSALTQITIPESVKTVGEYAFSGSGLTSVTVPQSVTEIHTFAFSGCEKLTEARLHAGLTVFGQYIFLDCTSLSTIYFSGTMAQWPTILYHADWDNNTGNYTVICSDGSLPKGTW